MAEQRLTAEEARFLRWLMGTIHEAPPMVTDGKAQDALDRKLQVIDKALEGR